MVTHILEEIAYMWVLLCCAPGTKMTKPRSSEPGLKQASVTRERERDRCWDVFLVIAKENAKDCKGKTLEVIPFDTTPMLQERKIVLGSPKLQGLPRSCGTPAFCYPSPWLHGSAAPAPALSLTLATCLLPQAEIFTSRPRCAWTMAALAAPQT